MGRRFPTDDIALIHPILALSLIAAATAATIVIITGLCSMRFKKGSPSPEPLSPAAPRSSASPPIRGASNRKSDAFTSPSTLTTADPANRYSQLRENTEEEDNTTPTVPEKKEDLEKELPLPPKLLQPADSSNNIITKSSSERRLTSNFSVRMPRSMSMTRKRDQNKDSNHRKNLLSKASKSFKPEEAVWTKTIILGERCRVPAEDDDTVIHDGKGNIISTYHPRSSISLSRQNSVLD